ncbi:tyrosine-type recombinase/integrase [Lapidilactobacillus dextrinicus]|uniref:tyrosine-type recombinase/integrase n=1 Tax=Lapidilactobacillus dextrinicus TaxID=51664 RepID=UPI0022DEB69C|nr:site-specific integrase [Lapidilactobacillus dextrinicus]
MYFEKRKNKKGNPFFVVTDRYIDPLTGRFKRASVVYHRNTSRCRNEAIHELGEKIEQLISDKEDLYKGDVIRTFGDLKESWFSVWQETVKPPTVHREKMVLKRLTKLIDDKVLLERITPLLVQNCLRRYKEKYHVTHSTMQHIKCTLNKIFDYGVLYSVIPFSPSRVVKLQASIADKQAKKKRREAKFLDQRELRVLLQELKKRRNQNYYDLTLFLIGTGCRIGEAMALTEDDIDFDNQLLNVDKSLQYHDLKIDEFYLDTTKTEAGERVEQLPDFVIEAIKRVINRNRQLDWYVSNHPRQGYHKTDFIFRTENGTPVTARSYGAVLRSIGKYLNNNCEEVYGFKWTKNAIPHSFRHIHISILRDDPTIPLKEIQTRVGHVQAETTNGYTHLVHKSQEKSVIAICKFVEKIC